MTAAHADIFFDTEDFGLGFRISSFFTPHLQMAYYVSKQEFPAPVF